MGVGKPVYTTCSLIGEGIHVVFCYIKVQFVLEYRHPSFIPTAGIIRPQTCHLHKLKRYN